jgi:hypothetical protein
MRMSTGLLLEGLQDGIPRPKADTTTQTRYREKNILFHLPAACALPRHRQFRGTWIEETNGALPCLSTK